MLAHCTTVGNVDRLVFVGERDWESLDAWERSKVGKLRSTTLWRGSRRCCWFSPELTILLISQVTLAAQSYIKAHPHIFRVAGSPAVSFFHRLNSFGRL